MDRSRVQLDEVTDDAQPETQPGVTLRGRILRLTEALEYVWQEIRADPTAGVDDPDLHVIGRRPDEDAHPRSRVNFFMNKFKKLGYIEDSDGLKVNDSLVTVIPGTNVSDPYKA